MLRQESLLHLSLHAFSFQCQPSTNASTLVNRVAVPSNPTELISGSDDLPFEHLAWASHTNGVGQLVSNPQRGICNIEVDEAATAAAMLTNSSSSNFSSSPVVCNLSPDGVDEVDHLSRGSIPHLRPSVLPGVGVCHLKFLIVAMFSRHCDLLPFSIDPCLAQLRI